MQQYPSIFNDVIGPLMIGNSSSHTAASVRIGNLVRQLAGGPPAKIQVRYDAHGSLAATHESQLADSALLAGLLGYDTADPEILRGPELARQAGIQFQFSVQEIGPGHPNTYYLDCDCANGKQMQLEAISTGGGSFRLTDFQGFAVELGGGFYEALLLCSAAEHAQLQAEIPTRLPQPHRISATLQQQQALIRVQAQQPFRLQGLSAQAEIRYLEPILPVRGQLAPRVPFASAAQILACAAQQPRPLWQLAAYYESCRSGLTEAEVFAHMRGLLQALRTSFAQPLPPDTPNRILPNQAHLLQGKTLLGGSFQQALSYHVTRFMDIKASWGVVLAAPTAGACACLPGTVLALGQELHLAEEELVQALLAAGLVGVLIAQHSTFAAEIGGCQAECGAGSGMAAAACAQICQGSAAQCLDAASLALQNVFGLTCDPVAMRVEVPCLGKNLLGACNAVTSANLALAGFDVVIPLDETIQALDQVGRLLPAALRCTGGAGLTTTPTACAIRRRLESEA